MPIGDCPEVKVTTYPATLASQGRDHRLTAPVPSIRNTYMDMLWMDTARHSVVRFHNGNPVLVHSNEAPRSSIKPSRIGDSLQFGHSLLRRSPVTSSPVTSSSATGSGAQLNPRTSNITGPEGVGTQSDPSSDAETDAEAFFGPSPLPFGGSTVLRLTHPTTSRSRPRSRRNRSAASYLCTVLRRALYTVDEIACRRVLVFAYPGHAR